jgi:drug/metabolite transporter (DMT)-like permease
MTQESKAELSLIGVTAIWGAGYPIMSVTLRDAGPYTYVAFRSILAAIAFTIVFHKKLSKIDKTAVKGGLLIAITLAVGNILQVLGLLYTTPSKSSFITSLSVIFVPLIIAIIYKKLPGKYTVLAVIFSLIGLFLMSYPGGKGGLNKGDLLTLSCALCYSFQILLVDRYGKKTDVIALTCIELIFVAILSLIPGIAFEGLKMTFNTVTIGALIFTAIFGSAIGMWVQNKMQPYTNPSHAAVIYLGEPVFGAFFSIFIGDILSGRALAGCIIVLVGMLIVSLKNN